MGRRGPKKTPTRILEARGSWLAKTRPNEPQPKPARVAPRCPAHIRDATARRHWKKIAELLMTHSVLTDADITALGFLVSALGEFFEADAILAKFPGGIYENSKGDHIRHPATRIRANAFDRALKLMREFGLTPSSRAGLQAGNNGNQETDDLVRIG